MESLKGQLLISGGGLFDPNFRHTVILIGEHNEEGALGVVLNRTLSATVEDTVPALSHLVAPGTLLHQGGPVQPTSPVLLVELTRPDLADVLIFGSVGFLVGDVPPDIGPDIERARVYAGYSGWGPGQLEAEMADDSWITEPAAADDVFTDAPERLWRTVLERKGGRFSQLARVPFDPTMN